MSVAVSESCNECGSHLSYLMIGQSQSHLMSVAVV